MLTHPFKTGRSFFTILNGQKVPTSKIHPQDLHEIRMQNFQGPDFFKQRAERRWNMLTASNTPAMMNPILRFERRNPNISPVLSGGKAASSAPAPTPVTAEAPAMTDVPVGQRKGGKRSGRAGATILSSFRQPLGD